MPSARELFAAAILTLALTPLVVPAEAGAAKVFTLEKVGGPEVVLNDVVAAKLETAVQFIKENGEVECTTSELKGKVKANPNAGETGEIEFESWTFSACNSDIGGPGGVVKRLKPESFPVIAKTGTSEGKKAFVFKTGTNFGMELWVETDLNVEINCTFFGPSGQLLVLYENGNSEMEISQELTGVLSQKNCFSAPNNSTPKMKAKYRPLQDETGGRKGKRIFLN